MTIKINDTEYSFNTSFNEFTIDEYLPLLSVINLPIIERVSKYTSIPIEILNSIALENVSAIIEAVSFIENYSVLNALAVPYLGTDIGLQSFGKFEQAKSKTIIEIVEIYTGEKIIGKPLLEVWNMCQFYSNSLNGFVNKFKKLNLHEYTDEELEADVEVLEGFKHYGIVFTYGKNRGMTNDQVLNLPAIEVYTELLYDYERAEYEKRYNQVMQQHQEHFNKLV